MGRRSGSGPPKRERPDLAGSGALESKGKPRTINSAEGAAQALADLRFRRDVERLHRLGPRALLELLADLAAQRMIRTEIEVLVAYYAGGDPALVRAFGGDRLPPPVLLVRP